MASPKASGFFGGLLEGFAGALYDRHQQQEQQKIEAQKTLAGVLLRGLDADPTRETATAVLPAVASILNVPLAGLFGGKGKGKGGKGGAGLEDGLQGFFGGLGQAFPTRADVDKRKAQELQIAEDIKVRGAGQTEAARLAAQRADQAKELDTLDAEYTKLGGKEGTGLSRREFLEERGFFKAPTRRSPQWIAGVVSGAALPEGSVDIYGQPLDRTKYYKQGTDESGKPIFGPTTTPASEHEKPLTGAAKQAIDTELIGMGLNPPNVSPDSPQYREAMRKAYRVLVTKRNLDNASRGALLEMRKWMLGEDIGGPGGGGGAAPGAGGGGTGTPNQGAAAPKKDGAPAEPKTGEAVLKGLPPSEAAEVRQVAEYRKALPARYFNSPRGAKILGLVEQYTGKSFDQTVYQQRQRARIAFTSGKAGDNIRSLNTAAGHLATLADKSLALKNGGLQLWNQIANKGLEATGDARVDAFKTAANAVAGELSTLFKGTAGTDTEIKNWRERLNEVKSPEQLNEILQTAASLAESRLTALQGQWRSAMGDTPFDFVTPDAQKAFARFGAIGSGMSRSPSVPPNPFRK